MNVGKKNVILYTIALSFIIGNVIYQVEHQQAIENAKYEQKIAAFRAKMEARRPMMEKLRLEREIKRQQEYNALMNEYKTYITPDYHFYNDGTINKIKFLKNKGMLREFPLSRFENKEQAHGYIKGGLHGHMSTDGSFLIGCGGIEGEGKIRGDIKGEYSREEYFKFKWSPVKDTYFINYFPIRKVKMVCDNSKKSPVMKLVFNLAKVTPVDDTNDFVNFADYMVIYMNSQDMENSEKWLF